MTDIITLAKQANIAFKPMVIDGVEYEYRHVEFNDSVSGDEAGCIERFAELIRADERSKSQSFSDKHPPNPDAKCKCEHWQACKECHPTAFKGAAP